MSGMTEYDGMWTNYIYANGRKIARTGMDLAAVVLTGVRDETTASCGVEGSLTSASVAGLTIAQGDALVMDTKQNVATYGGVALIFDDGTGTSVTPAS